MCEYTLFSRPISKTFDSQSFVPAFSLQFWRREYALFPIANKDESHVSNGHLNVEVK